jgi:S-ribosylhomocysteine lyase LuxS involved in autoinducer biosynthesis
MGKDEKENKFSVLDFAYLNPEELAEKQHAELKKHCIKVLQHITTLIQKDDYKTIRELVKFSPAGDDMGTDSNFIDFGKGSDIIDIVNRLEHLKKIKDMWEKKDGASDE